MSEKILIKQGYGNYTVTAYFETYRENSVQNFVNHFNSSYDTVQRIWKKYKCIPFK